MATAKCVLTLKVQDGHKLLRYHQSANSNAIGPKSSAAHIKYFSYGNCFDMRGDVCRTFAYIRTADALSVYKRW
jgi:hypothetical protein